MRVIENKSERSAEDAVVNPVSKNDHVFRKDGPPGGKETGKEVTVHGEDTVPMRVRRRRQRK